VSLLITAQLLEDFLTCKTKAYLNLAGQRAEPSDYQSQMERARADLRLRVIDRILSEQSPDSVVRGVELTRSELGRGPSFAFEVTLSSDTFDHHFDGLKRVEGSSKLGRFHYIPILFHEDSRVRKVQRQILAVYGALLTRVQGTMPEIGIVWHGNQAICSKIRLGDLRREAEQLLESLAELQRNSAEPMLMLNDHCPACQFRERCRQKAIGEDNLSLLRGIGEKDIRRYARKGIFTVSQLSHTFRPRRKGKRADSVVHKRHAALQAMAIRDKTIYVLGSPKLESNATKVYLDIEATDDDRFVYLIGIIVVQGDSEWRESFWANNPQDERAIFLKLVNKLARLGDYTMFTYGSYELSFLRRMQRDPKLKPQVDQILAASTNILSVIYSHFYFPTYSNGLKDIATCLGCTWSDANASGLQSLVWRARWDVDRQEQWKAKLLQYNLDDCQALKAVTDHILDLTAGDNSTAPAKPASMTGLRVATVREFDERGRVRKWGEVKFVHPDYAFVNRCAYFDYQQQRVYVQTNRMLRKRRHRPWTHRWRKFAVTRREEVSASACEQCGSSDLIAHQGRVAIGRRKPRPRRSFDLVASKSGIKLGVIECRSKLYECRKCGSVFVPETHRRLDRYFHGLRSWAMYQHIAHGLSFGIIREMIETFFGLRLNRNEIVHFKTQMAWYYESTCRQLWDKLMAGHLLHVDETQCRLKGGKTAYVWAFTNLEEVVYMYRPSREGEFLRELLKSFRGVLVTDFYTAYDAIECPQQKCLVHLIRDMNDDLVANPFDDELQAITEPFGALLRPIITCISEHGLRRRHLRRFKRAVADFFHAVSSSSPRSDVACALRDRLLKNQSKLFTFLDFDNVPWNNNNAENAIKRFALYRARAAGTMKDTGLETLLKLLSLCQTCKYKGLNFWRFLCSRKRDIDDFAAKPNSKPPTQLEVCPEEFPDRWRSYRARTMDRNAIGAISKD